MPTLFNTAIQSAVVPGLGTWDLEYQILWDFEGGNGNDFFQGGSASEMIKGGYGQDLLAGGGGHDRIYGDQGDDTLLGQAGNDSLFGGDGADWLIGGANSGYGYARLDEDNLVGGAGADRLEGGIGNDRLEGGQGTDVLVGGRGSDRFVFTGADVPHAYHPTYHSPVPGPDTITDFELGAHGRGTLDVIDLRSLLDGTSFGGTTIAQAISAGYISLVQHGSSGQPGFGTTIYFDPNGNAADTSHAHEVALVEVARISANHVQDAIVV